MDSKKLNETTEKLNRWLRPEGSISPRFITEDLVVYYCGNWGDVINNVPPAKDKIDILWISTWFRIFKLEGENLATIRDQLLSFDLGFRKHNDKILIDYANTYEGDGLFAVWVSKMTAVWFPNVKIIEYEIEDIEQDKYGREIITLKHKESVK